MKHHELVNRLRLTAQQLSDAQRRMAEAKSLRQAGNSEGRTDLYMWPAPHQTLEGKAADAIESLEEEVGRLRASRERRQ